MRKFFRSLPLLTRVLIGYQQVVLIWFPSTEMADEGTGRLAGLRFVTVVVIVDSQDCCRNSLTAA